MSATQTGRRSQAERSAETKERIILAAINLLRSRGFAGLRVADVTEEAGVSRGAQSHHFHSKADLVLAVFARMFEDAGRESAGRLAEVGEDDDIVAAMVEDAANFFLHPDFAIGLDLLAAAERDPELREGVRAISRDNRLAVEDAWLAELERRGVSHEAALDILWLVFSTIRGLSVRMLWQVDTPRFERVKQLAYEAGRALYLDSGGKPAKNKKHAA
ncbi:TetR/AcrR family transcriptional regulator [Massilia sp. 9I]|uniref:TetR/AcrR family transcriptional regulator n=1 Tax=Massilia sp. 9I TaxID=2653152 RepID=UPI0012F214FD|nr:TetR/AcrR family transcriptional regulator [Massilia sp. 9I]VXB12971.1 HTH-type transcriptional regulator CymR [Massilia sp. 9I]